MARQLEKHSKRASSGKRVGLTGHRSAAKPGATGRATKKCSTRRKRTKPLTEIAAVSASASDHLTCYFRDLSEHDLLAPEDEQSLAQGIEENEVHTWEVLLASPIASEYVINMLAKRLGKPLKNVQQMRQVALAAGVSPTSENLATLGTVAQATARVIRPLDLDRLHIDAVLGRLEGLRVGAIQHTNLAFSPKSEEFAALLRAAKVTYNAAMKLRNDFVHANLRLVVTMARRYDHGGMPLADLIQEGNLGLMHAVSRFDYRRGLRFSTYACWWIRHAIGRALADKSRAVRIPVHMLEAQQQVQKIQQQLVTELGRNPTQGELAAAANMPISKLNQMHKYLMGQPMSLDRPSHDEDDRAYGDLVPDPLTENVSLEEHLTTRALADQVERLLGDLTPIEADVLRQRFGLWDDNERTFREIGAQYELSRERIRQIQNSALGKLRRALERTVAS
jgi:RNA polymerase primary sigma factor